jgi:hypothetical protein
MNAYFVIAAALCMVVGLVHSVLGETRIFRRLRQGGVVPSLGGPLLEERHVRILWASWHVLTVFGWGIACVLLWLSLPESRARSTGLVEAAIMTSMFAGSALVCIGTKARHPGWVGLFAVAVLTWLGRVR